MDVTLLDLMKKGESGARGYNAYNRGTYGKDTIGGREEIDFSELTVAEIQRRQSLPLGTPGNFSTERVFAIGKYQVIPDTLQAAVDHLGIQPDEKFTPQLQDKIFTGYLLVEKQKAVYGYVTGDERYSLYNARRQMAFEWASFPDPSKPGDVSYYGKPNAAHISNAEVVQVLTDMHREYAESIANGLSPQDAWIAATGVSAQESLEFKGVPYAVPEPRPLAAGAKGQAVEDLQKDLNNIGVTNNRGERLVTDGDYGQNTREAIEAFQREHNLPMTGNADRPTLTAIHMHASAAQVASDLQKSTRPYQAPGHRDDWMQTNEQGLPNYLRAAVDAPSTHPGRDEARHGQGALEDGALKIGERGPEVARLQESLIHLGINDHVKQPIKADGVFGPDTQRAVQAFQLWHGADHVNGIADRQTLAAINTQAGLAIIQRTMDQAQGAPSRDFIANVNIGAPLDPGTAADSRDIGSPPTGVAAPAPGQRVPHAAEPGSIVPTAEPIAAPARPEPVVGSSQLSPSDQAMFAKIRGSVPAYVPDETVANAMLQAKRNGIPDADRIDKAAVVDGKLWVAGVTPGYQAGVSVNQPAPAMQDTLRETQVFNQQLAQEAIQRGPDDPSRGPKM